MAQPPTPTSSRATRSAPDGGSPSDSTAEHQADLPAPPNRLREAYATLQTLHSVLEEDDAHLRKEYKELAQGFCHLYEAYKQLDNNYNQTIGKIKAYERERVDRNREFHLQATRITELESENKSQYDEISRILDHQLDQDHLIDNLKNRICELTGEPRSRGVSPAAGNMEDWEHETSASPGVDSMEDLTDGWRNLPPVVQNTEGSEGSASMNDSD
ncbi:hypothetical protein P280DRAFT_215690 [Massarina eburnea CBS 473.64]|uniref:Uncharacterized protein n=1 Tax=Massarina eburnea CBS 473.64 TaxID=1395130 RepID=A0A6A6S817_9PLEO|nr:hypothetical protein P280DRAFT_215690 [Massarina eburnea CBS 473.64]